MTYRFPVMVGDRVALAPHLDLFMAGVRFGLVSHIEHNGPYGAAIYTVDYGNGVIDRTVRVLADDLLGAVNPIPGQYADKIHQPASPSRLDSPNPDSIGAGWPEEAQS